MIINKIENGTSITIALKGRLDTTTAPQLEGELNASLGGKDTLIFDLKELEYVSSAGLRLFLTAQKTMNKQGKMIVKNVNDTVNEVFEVTGFLDI